MSRAQGDKAEEAAVNYLQDNGYEIIERNFHARVGEIDIIARDGDVICFVEVRMRNENYGIAEETLSPTKRARLQQSALHYIQQHNLDDVQFRFDFVALNNNSAYPTIRLYKNVM